MKKIFLGFFMILLVFGFTFSSCVPAEDSNTEDSKKYSIGDVVKLGEKEFYVYGIQSEEVFLLAKETIGVATYGEVDAFISQFQLELAQSGIYATHVGLLNYEVLDDLGGNKHSNSISGQPYLCDDAPDFVKLEESYWLSGYSKYESYTWLYESEKIFYIQYKDYAYAVRPVVHMKITNIL